PAAGAAPAQTGRALVMAEYLRSMQQFLDLQRGLMTGLAGGAPVPAAAQPAAPPPAAPPDALPHGPFRIEVTELAPRSRLAGRCRVDHQVHRYLAHHTLGRQPSRIDPQLSCLAVVPLTFSIELMAQAAALLAPGLSLAGMRAVRGHRWLEPPEDGALELLIEAERQPGAGAGVEVAVAVRDAGPGGFVFLEGRLLFGLDWPPVTPLVDPERDCGPALSVDQERFYENILFHGPMFRAVRSLDRLGLHGAAGTLVTLPADDLFAPPSGPFLTDPVLMDAAGQVVGGWAVEHLVSGFIMFPTGFTELRLLAPKPAPGAVIACNCRITLSASGRITSDIDLVAEDGQLLAQIVGWEDMRLFDWSLPFYAFLLAPCQRPLAHPWQEPPPERPGMATAAVVVRENGGGIWPRVLAGLVLSRVERARFAGLGLPERQRRRWLLGRAAAKEAVRLFLGQHHGQAACDADIEIVEDEGGRLAAGGVLLAGQPAIAVAVAGSGEQMLAVAAAGALAGLALAAAALVDDHPALDDQAWTAAELALLAELAEGRQAEWRLRLWCAREAAKQAASGQGLAGPVPVLVRGMDRTTGQVAVAVAAAVAAGQEGMAVSVATGREGDAVYGLAVW
ncbi:MAG: polyketide synthase dehydratase domain-containing protein, partial [Thermodesulfobacteriota bacterium]